MDSLRIFGILGHWHYRRLRDMLDGNTEDGREAGVSKSFFTTPRTDQAFIGDPSVGEPPSVENWGEAVEFARWLEKDLIAIRKEHDLLRRQVEVLATSLTEAANELMPYGGYSYHIKKWREQIKEAQKGCGGG